MEQAAHLADDEQYGVRNLKEIIQILADLGKHKANIKVSFNSGIDTCLTQIIEVDTKNHAVYLDSGLDDGFNSRLLAANYVLFSKEDGVKVRWVSHHVSMVTLKDGRALKIALPESVVRLQRREYFRVATPVVNPVACQISVPDPEKPELRNTLRLPLSDIGIGGVGLLVHDKVHPSLVEGVSFDGCQMDLPDVGKINVTLQVKNIIPMKMRDGSVKYRVGLLFVKPSFANESLIHRYTFNLEREHCSKVSKQLF